MKFRTLITGLAILLIPMTNAAFADNKAIVQTFYDYLSNPSSETHAASVKAVISEDWESIGDYSGKVKPRDKFMGQVTGFGQLIPDLDWSVQEMLLDGNRVIVISRATGTPNAPFFGVDGKGNGFDIMTIDIHTVEDGKISQTYRVEDWAGALQQLQAK